MRKLCNFSSFSRIGDHKGAAHEGELVAGAQFLTTHGADFAVDLYLFVQNQLLCFAAGIDHVGNFKCVLQLDKFGMNSKGLGIIFNFDCYFLKINLRNS